MSTDRLADAITDAPSSPNEPDANMEPANVVDGLYAIAHTLNRVAAAIEVDRAELP